MMCKRILDIFISSSVMLLLLPVFLVVIIAIRLTSRDPAIFKQEQAGREFSDTDFNRFAIPPEADSS